MVIYTFGFRAERTIPFTFILVCCTYQGKEEVFSGHRGVLVYQRHTWKDAAPDRKPAEKVYMSPAGIVKTAQWVQGKSARRGSFNVGTSAGLLMGRYVMER
jgi:hypothetical protein